MRDGPPSTLTPAERLAALRARQAAWDSLAWRARTEQAMGHGSVWELYGGVLSSTLSREHLALTAEFLRGDECAPSPFHRNTHSNFCPCVR